MAGGAGATGGEAAVREMRRKAQNKGRKSVRLVDLPGLGGLTKLEWSKRRWECTDSGCGVGLFTEQADWIAPERARLTTRAAKWAASQVGRGRTEAEVAEELGCDWRTVAEELNPGPNRLKA